MTQSKRPAPFPNDPSFGDLSVRVAAEIDQLRDAIKQAEDLERDLSAREDVTLFGELEHRIRNAALVCRIEAIFQRLPLPPVNVQALPRSVRKDGSPVFKIVAGNNIQPARGRKQLVIVSDLFLVSNEGRLHTLRADRIGPEIGHWHQGHKDAGFWTPFVRIFRDRPWDGICHGAGEVSGKWPRCRNEFGPFDPECLVDRHSPDPYAALVSFTQWMETVVNRARKDIQGVVTTKLREIAQRARRLDSSDRSTL